MKKLAGWTKGEGIGDYYVTRDGKEFFFRGVAEEDGIEYWAENGPDGELVTREDLEKL